MYINQLAASLPQCSQQKLDKSSILKQGVDYLRKFNGKLKSPPFIVESAADYWQMNYDLKYLLLLFSVHHAYVVEK